MAEKIPETIGKYKIMSLVAKGGMGAVYKAVHPSLKRLVIIKKLTIRNNATVKERFKREAQILLDMQSPYIVHLFDYFTEGQSHYIVEEFVDGLSLAQLLDKQVALGTELALLIFHDACLSLKFAHARGIVHRDIKPGNILISKRAEVKLADFGIASSESGDELPLTPSADSSSTKVDGNLTQSGVTLGTPAYMSPEQITDSRSVDKRADIYSMGVMLYEMLTGSKPFPSNLNPETLEKIKKGKYINPRKIDKNIPPVICRMIKKMLRANPDRRFQSIEKVIAIVKKYLSHYNTHKIRIALAQCVLSKKQFTLPAFERKQNKAKKVGIIIASVLAFAAAFGFVWYKGYIHKTVLSHWYREVVINMQMPKTSSVNSDLPVRAFFFVDDGNSIPEVSGTRRVFNEKTSENSANSKTKNYQTYPVYLREGNYRVKIAAGPYVIWQSLKVESKAVTLNINSLKNRKTDVTINTTSYDSATGKSLTADTKFFLSYRGKWVPLEEVPAQDIKSGSIIKVLARCEGYRDAVYSLLLDWYQDELIISAAMQKTEESK
ncbi:MAG: serine/threonine protein kinase [Treponema sp.]|nr:serine/threonine protein kinase [Treponema sp.]MBR0487157.1 serine/threonine protein kinase [Treponema sp.]